MERFWNVFWFIMYAVLWLCGPAMLAAMVWFMLFYETPAIKSGRAAFQRGEPIQSNPMFGFRNKMDLEEGWEREHDDQLLTTSRERGEE